MINFILEEQAKEKRKKEELLQSVTAICGANFVKMVALYRKESKHDAASNSYESYPDISDEVFFVNLNLYKQIDTTSIYRNLYNIDERRIARCIGYYGKIEALYLVPFGNGYSILCVPFSEAGKTKKAIIKLMKAKKLIERK